MDLARLPTEQHRRDLADLDHRPSSELARLMGADTGEVADAIEAVAQDLGTCVDRIAERLAGTTGRMIYVGAGTAGRIGLLDAAECGPTFNTDRVVGVLAGGDVAFGDAREAAEDDEAAAVEDLDALGVHPDDAVVGISASGRTPYTVAAVDHARSLGALTVGVANNPDSPLGRHADLAVEVLTGPELIAGSTRLKAGTAQKVVCNTLSTGVMVRLGKTYGNLMVDVRATNAKLRDRARRIVVAATDADDAAASQALAASDGEVKLAILMLLLDVDAAGARTRLEASGGAVRAAMEARP